MAMAVQPLLIGVDVSKAELVIARSDQAQLETIANEAAAIRRWLKRLAGPVCIAVEATNTFHLALLSEAHRLGHTLYVLDGYRLNRYRESIGTRAKTDARDAGLILRYLSHERAELRPWSPPCEGYLRLQRLLHRRATLIQAKTTLTQSLRELPELRTSTHALLRQLDRLDQLIQKRLRQALSAAGWTAQALRCQAVEGIGPITAAALTMAFHRGAFRSSDAFIAFIGLDVRVRDSGRLRGRRKLTKQGDPELRRLLYLAAMQASRQPAWAAFYQRYLQRGLAKTQALVILARKLARIAFALLQNQTDYVPEIACSGT